MEGSATQETSNPVVSDRLPARQAAADARRRRRRTLVVTVITFGMVLAGTLAALLSMINPLHEPFFVPVWVTQYDSRLLPMRSFAEADRDSILAANIFSVGATNELFNPTRYVLESELQNLANVPEQSVVIYLSSFAIIDDRGVCLLPSDVDPFDKQTYLPLNEVLSALASCSARNKFLILDVVHSFSDPRLGILPDDLVEGIIEQLNSVPDSNRFVLLSCSSNQVAQTSPTLRRSVFSYYVEQGLKGLADGYNPSGRRDSRVSVCELSSFVAARVDRWARLASGTRQIPQLIGDARDFELSVSLPDDKIVEDELERLFPRPKPEHANKKKPETTTATATKGQGASGAAATASKAGTTTKDPSKASGDSKEPATAAGKNASTAKQAGTTEPSSSSKTAAASTTSTSPSNAERAANDSEFPEPQYPDWLLAGWKLQDQWRATRAHRAAPRLYEQLVYELFRITDRWRSGHDMDDLKEELSARMDQLERRYQEVVDFPRPRPFSLAAAKERGEQIDPTIVEAVNQSVVKWQAAQTPTAKPEQVATEVSKLISDFAAKCANLTPFPVEYAIHQAAINDSTLTLAKIQFLNGLRKAVYVEPHFLETRLLEQLGQLSEVDIAASNATNQDELRESWKLLLAQTVQVDLQAERAIQRPVDFSWLSSFLNQAENLCWDGERLILSMGYVPYHLAQSAIGKASTAFQEIRSTAESLDVAFDTLEMLACDLSMTLATYRFSSATDLSWETSIRASLRLLQTLFVNDAPLEGKLTSPIRLEQLRQNSLALVETTRTMMSGYAPASITALADQAMDRSAPPRLKAQIEGILETPFIDAESRKRLSLAQIRLEDRLAKAVLELDRADNRAGLSTPAPIRTASGRDSLTVNRRQRAINQARHAIMLLELADFEPTTIERLKQLLGEAIASGSSLEKVGEAMRMVWGKDLAEQLRSDTRLAAQTRLSFAFHPLQRNLILDDPTTNPVRRLTIRESFELWKWIAAQLEYQSHDAASSMLLASAAREYSEFVNSPPSTFPIITHEFDLDLDNQTPGVVSGQINIQIFSASVNDPKLGDFDAVTANDAWFSVQLDPARQSQANSTFPGMNSRQYTVPFKLFLQPQAFDSAIPCPKGFLVRLPIGDRLYHHLVPLPQPSPFAADGLALMIGTDPSAPSGPAQEMRLRPLGTNQEYFLFVHNRLESEQKLQVTVAVGDQPPTFSGDVTVPARSTSMIPLAKQPEPKEGLPTLSGPIVVTMTDPTAGTPTRRFTIPVSVIPPAEYVRVVQARFEPAAPPALQQNRLTVVVEQIQSVSGPPIEVALAFPKALIDGFEGEAAGTLKATLGGASGRRTLVAEGLQFTPTASRSGSFAVNVDAVERAFVFDSSFAAFGSPSSPTLVDQPRVRLDASLYAKPSSTYTVTIPVDGAAAGNSVRLHMGAIEPGLITLLNQPRQQWIGCQLGSPKGGLLLAATIRDWSVDLDTTGLSGPQPLDATLLTQNGQPIADRFTTVYIDARPPEIEFFDTPAMIPANATLTAGLVIRDADVPIDQVRLFFGSLAKDGSVPPSASLVDVEYTDPRVGLWNVTMELPEGTKKGPLALTALALNRAGLTSSTTMTINVSDAAPAGKIEGVVTVGTLRQPKCDIYLIDSKGKVVKQTKTDANGVYRLDNVPAGKYKLASARQASQQIRTAATEVTVEANKTITVNLKLAL